MAKKREVWLVEIGADYEGGEAVSAWGSEQEASAEAARIAADPELFRFADYTHIYRLVIGAPYEKPCN